MLNDLVLNKLSTFEKSEYNRLSEEYWQSNDQLAEKRMDMSYDTGNLTVEDLKRINDATFLNLQLFENAMRGYYSSI